MPDQALQATIDEVYQRLQKYADHRLKLNATELVKESIAGGYCEAWSKEDAMLLEALHDIFAANDPAQCVGDPLDQEIQDFLVETKPWWDDEEKLWALLLEHRVLVSNGSIPAIQRVASWAIYRDDDHTGEIAITENHCPICGYEEPAFYTINVPSGIFEEVGEFFQFDELEDDEIHYDDAHGFDTSYWDAANYAVMTMLRAIVRATQAGVRINALSEGTFAFDDIDDDEIREGDTGFDEGRWDGSFLEYVQQLSADLDVPLEFAACFHSCAPTRQYWEINVEWGTARPGTMEFDAEDDDVSRTDWLRGLDGGVWAEEEG